MGNPVVHWELMSQEPAKVAGFYEKLFGWKVQHRPELNYRIVDTGVPKGEMPGINGGIVKPDREGPWPEIRQSPGYETSVQYITIHTCASPVKRRRQFFSSSTGPKWTS